MLSNDLYEEKLNLFKENEKPEVVLLIADDTERIKIVVAWANSAIRRRKRLSRLRSLDVRLRIRGQQHGHSL